MTIKNRSPWAIFLTITAIGITWLAIFEHQYQPWIYRYGQEVTIVQAGGSELHFNHPKGCWASGGRVGEGM